MYMEYVFIDTSVFESNNFLEGKRINQLLRLSEEGYISIILPELIYKEILNRVKKNLNEAINKFSRYRNDTRVLRNIESLKTRFENIDEKECYQEFEELIKKRFQQSKIGIIDYPVVNIKAVFDSYFDRKFPFGAGIKKSEFPDAFALITVEKWCEDNGTTCKVLSKDKDILNYESDKLDIIENYEVYLDEKTKAVEKEKQQEKRLEKLEQSFNKEKGEFIKHIEDWIHVQLDNDSKYYEYSNYLDVHGLEINDIYVELGDYQITNIDEDIIAIQCEANISYSVDIEIDDENNAWYDDEDKVWHYMDTTTERIEDEDVILVDLTIEIPQAGDEFAELEIVEINEGKDLRI